ncbi:MAG: lipid II:glycine glycyltransferase FemX [Spirochaetaceae bacterium]
MRSRTGPSAEMISPQGKDVRKGANLFQSPFWAAQKERFGWKAFWSDGSPPSLLLHRKLPGPFSVVYVPYGGTAASEGFTHLRPPETFSTGEYVRELQEAVQGEGLNPTCIRWDVPFPTESLPAPPAMELEEAGLVKAPTDVQPPDTVLLSLNRSEEQLLSEMKSKTRYNIRLAAKKGVRVELGDWKEDLDSWLELYRVTAERDRIAIHRPEYYRSLFGLAEAEDPRELSLSLYLAYHEKELLAGIIVGRFREAAYYLYGASANEKRNLMPAYALQWRAIQDAREGGAGSYDLFGIPPAEEPAHPMHGLYRFKVGFGGSIVRRPGAWDLPIRGLAYSGFRVAEGARSYYHKVIRKRGV